MPMLPAGTMGRLQQDSSTPGSHERAAIASPGAPICSAMAGLCTLPSCWRMPVVLKIRTEPSDPAVACSKPADVTKHNSPEWEHSLSTHVRTSSSCSGWKASAVTTTLAG